MSSSFCMTPKHVGMCMSSLTQGVWELFAKWIEKTWRIRLTYMWAKESGIAGGSWV
ncbi:hypothetical protein C8N44_10643 [Allosediminivita pacifica]|uniref:Uncharacterized protein n=1 Tax=Allosediminivita pacifica TaxID=1267769 RepID=A0A2T6B0S6_9RHOB|nr:hypothetical protein C8N44_10643 [Allosediminivita pacifica]